jgi:hypothetical protein
LVLFYPEGVAPEWWHGATTNYDVACQIMEQAGVREAANGGGSEYLKYQLRILNRDREAEGLDGVWYYAIRDQYERLEHITPQ